MYTIKSKRQDSTITAQFGDCTTSYSRIASHI